MLQETPVEVRAGMRQLSNESYGTTSAVARSCGTFQVLVAIDSWHMAVVRQSNGAVAWSCGTSQVSAASDSCQVDATAVKRSYGTTGDDARGCGASRSQILAQDLLVNLVP